MLIYWVILCDLFLNFQRELFNVKCSSMATSLLKNKLNTNKIGLCDAKTKNLQAKMHNYLNLFISCTHKSFEISFLLKKL